MCIITSVPRSSTRQSSGPNQCLFMCFGIYQKNRKEAPANTYSSALSFSLLTTKRVIHDLSAEVSRAAWGLCLNN